MKVAYCLSELHGKGRALDAGINELAVVSNLNYHTENGGMSHPLVAALVMAFFKPIDG